MIGLIIKSYFSILIAMGVSFVVLFLLGIYLIYRFMIRKAPDFSSSLKNLKTTQDNTNKKTIITSQDIKAIAGEDVIATQLDLARAYIETGKTQFAKKILAHVIKQGTLTQQHEAEYLLSLI